MARIALLSAALAVMLASLSVTVAHAQLGQLANAFVSNTGNANGACTITDPCGTIAQAQTALALSGTIICLNSNDYGTATITKSIVIDCSGTSSSMGLPSIGPVLPSRFAMSESTMDHRITFKMAQRSWLRIACLSVLLEFVRNRLPSAIVRRRTGRHGLAVRYAGKWLRGRRHSGVAAGWCQRGCVAR